MRTIRWFGTLLLAGVIAMIVLSLAREFMPARNDVRGGTPGRPPSGFFDRRSALFPVTAGLTLMAVGIYGILFVANYEQSYDWIVYLGIAAGFFILKRTFAVTN